jgi:hypothetical protein
MAKFALTFTPDGIPVVDGKELAPDGASSGNAFRYSHPDLPFHAWIQENDGVKMPRFELNIDTPDETTLDFTLSGENLAKMNQPVFVLGGMAIRGDKLTRDEPGNTSYTISGQDAAQFFNTDKPVMHGEVGGGGFVLGKLSIPGPIAVKYDSEVHIYNPADFPSSKEFKAEFQRDQQRRGQNGNLDNIYERAKEALPGNFNLAGVDFETPADGFTPSATGGPSKAAIAIT